MTPGPHRLVPVAGAKRRAVTIPLVTLTGACRTLEQAVTAPRHCGQRSREAVLDAPNDTDTHPIETDGLHHGDCESSAKVLAVGKDASPPAHGERGHATASVAVWSEVAWSEFYQPGVIRPESWNSKTLRSVPGRF